MKCGGTEIRDQEMPFRLNNILLEKLLPKESIADVVIREHYEQRFLDLEYIFQQDHSGSKTNDSQNIELLLSRLTHKCYVVMNLAIKKWVVS